MENRTIEAMEKSAEEDIGTDLDNKMDERTYEWFDQKYMDVI